MHKIQLMGGGGGGGGQMTEMPENRIMQPLAPTMTIFFHKITKFLLLQVQSPKKGVEIHHEIFKPWFNGV